MSKVNPAVNYEVQWQNKFNELCHAVFYKDKIGQQLLQHMENKHFRMPVAYPDKDPSWAYFNEGKNELIRSFSQAIQMHMNKALATPEVKKTKRGR